MGLNGGPPASIEQLNIRLSADAVLVRAKPRSCLRENRGFKRLYLKQLTKKGLNNPMEMPEWVAAPLIVPKKPLTLYVMTIEYI